MEDEYWKELRMQIEELRKTDVQSFKAAPEFPVDKQNEPWILPAATRKSALRLLDFWPRDYMVLEVEYSYEDGELSFQAYKDDGQTVGGIHFKDDDRAWYAVTDCVTSVDSGCFDPGENREIEKVVENVVAHWKKLGIV